MNSCGYLSHSSAKVRSMFSVNINKSLFTIADNIPTFNLCVYVNGRLVEFHMGCGISGCRVLECSNLASEK